MPPTLPSYHPCLHQPTPPSCSPDPAIYHATDRCLPPLPPLSITHPPPTPAIYHPPSTHPRYLPPQVRIAFIRLNPLHGSKYNKTELTPPPQAAAILLNECAHASRPCLTPMPHAHASPMHHVNMHMSSAHAHAKCACACMCLDSTAPSACACACAC